MCLRRKIVLIAIMCLPAMPVLILDIFRSINDINVQRQPENAGNPEQIFIWWVIESVAAVISLSHLQYAYLFPIAREGWAKGQTWTRSRIARNARRRKYDELACTQEPKTLESKSNSTNEKLALAKTDGQDYPKKALPPDDGIVYSAEQGV